MLLRHVKYQNPVPYKHFSDPLQYCSWDLFLFKIWDVLMHFAFNPTSRGLWNGHRVGGEGAFKNMFRDHFDPIFLHRKGWGIKRTKENFFKMGFETKNCHFYILFIWTVTIAILHQKFEKVIKTTQNVSKPVDNH